MPLLKHEVNKRRFIFEGIRRWPVINLVTLIHWYSYLVSLEIVVGYRKLRSFQGTKVNLSVLLEKLDITYPSRNTNCRISPNHAENIPFQWSPPILSSITGDKVSL